MKECIFQKLLTPCWGEISEFGPTKETACEGHLPMLYGAIYRVEGEEPTAVPIPFDSEPSE